MTGVRGIVAVALSALAPGASARTDMSPVTRVVELLKGLSQKIEEEAKQEEDLFDTYMCWGKSVVSQKEASNVAANTRIETLDTYVADLKAGRIELTTERVDLEKEIAGLTGEIEEAEALRAQEEKDFLAAESEMEDAVKALTEALKVLRAGQGTKFLDVGSDIATFAREEGRLLEKVIAIGQQALGKGDALFLRRVLSADPPPKKDWKKLNRKATFKMKYEARSVKIEAVLQKLLENFSADLQEARKKEVDAKKVHTKLMSSKGEQKNKAEAAFSSLDKEGGARTMSMSEATAELEALRTQVTDDTKYIKEVNSAMEKKDGEWKQRKELRVEEVAAISKAISILHSDDARDLFKKSYGSQGYLFLQEGTSAVTAMEQRSRDAVEMLRRVAKDTKDPRIAGLAFLAMTTNFDTVIAAIDKMVTALETEDNEDLTKKETCESDRAKDTRDAMVLSREMDDLSDSIAALQAKIEEIEAEIGEKNESVKKIVSQLAEAKTIRERENADYLVAKKDDEDAVKLVGDAKVVLEQFYADNMALVQHRQSKAGEAPPPPPSTWEGSYGGKKAENQGVVAILGMIKMDIEADLQAGQTAEDDAVKEYGESKTALEKGKTDLEAEVSELEGAKSTHATDVGTNTGDRSLKKDELKAAIEKIQGAAPYCDFMLVNYNARAENRQIEISGLKKAKAVLKGAKFPEKETNLLQQPRLQRVSGHVA